MEKIISINEHLKEDGFSLSGYHVTTDKQTIKLLIDDEQDCCENYGYFMSNDDIDYFKGAELIDIKLTDISLNEVKTKNLCEYEGALMFIDLITSKGVLQFVAYNEHNGYYGHEACVISSQLNHSEIL